MQCSKTQFCGRMQKLLPKVGWRLVLSAPKKGSRASIATSNYENRPACSTHAEAFSAVGCRPDKNRTNSKRRIGSQILSDPLFAGAGAHFGKIQSGAGRKSSLRDDRKFPQQTPNSCAGNLFSRRY